MLSMDPGYMRTTLVAGGLRPARLERLLSLSTMPRVETVAKRYPMQASIVYQLRNIAQQSQSLFSRAHELLHFHDVQRGHQSRSRDGRPDPEGMHRIQLWGQASALPTEFRGVA